MNNETIIENRRKIKITNAIKRALKASVQIFTYVYILLINVIKYKGKKLTHE